MENRYYLTERPPMPGAIPGGGKVTEVIDYGCKKTVQRKDGKMVQAWGHILTRMPLTEQDISNYELTSEE